MITIGVVSGGIGAAALAGAFVTHRTLPTTIAKSKMIKLFKDGELYVKRGTKKGKSPNSRGHEIRHYPLVNRVTIYKDCIHIVFTIPDGMDPKNVTGALWLFKQVFGENIDLIGQFKTFTLALYGGDMMEFDYKEKELPDLSKYRLPVVIGKSRKGWETFDMAENPSLLIAGEPGSGKSAAIRSILTTLVDKCGDKIELYCADLKRSEFGLFRGIAKDVAMNTTDLMKIMNKMKKELQRRGDLLDDAGVEHIDNLPDKLPYIILAIDEVALLKKEHKIMDAIEEMSSIGRALGMFLILAMQRPDADVLDGKLKQNLTVRIAFRHADGINSRITIDSDEAATIKLSQRGRCYLKGEELIQVQVPFLSVPQARGMLEPYKKPMERKQAAGKATGPVIDVEYNDEESIWGVLDDEPEGQSDSKKSE